MTAGLTLTPVETERASMRVVLKLHDQCVGLQYPPSLQADLDVLLSTVRRDDTRSPTQLITVREQGGGRFLISGGGAPAADLGHADVLGFLVERIVQALIVDLASAPALHAGAVTWQDKAILIAGASGAGKSSLVAWLVEQGCSYVTDEICLVGDEACVVGLPRALVIKKHGFTNVEKFNCLKAAARVPVGADIALALGPAESNVDTALCCGLIVLPQFKSGSALEIRSLSPGEAAFRLMACNLNARNLADGGVRTISALSRAAPCITLQYGDFNQLDGVLDVLAKLLIDKPLDAAAGHRLLDAFARPTVADRTAASTYPIQAATPRKPARKLTIGMATYDDYDGVYFSLQALRLYHPEVVEDVEFLVVDNHPDGICAAALKKLEEKIPNYRYVPHVAETGTASPRNRVFEEAGGPFVLCMDSHVLFEAGSLKRLLSYLEANPDTHDLLQGPLVYDDLQSSATHFHPGWRKGMYGYWHKDNQPSDLGAPPFEVPMQGLGVFACRRAAWPGFNPRFRGFGGEEGYIHEKFRRAGGRVLCLPFLRWLHRFDRPLGVPYQNTWEDRIRNYMIGFNEVGLPTTELEEHFRGLLGAAADAIFGGLAEELEDQANRPVSSPSPNSP